MFTDGRQQQPNHNTTTYCGHMKHDAKKHSYNYQFHVMLFWSLFLHVSQSESYLSLDSYSKSGNWKSFLPSLIQSVSTIQIRRLNMKRVHETTTDDYKRQHPWHSRLGCLGRLWQRDGRQMSSDCVHQFVKNICLPFQSTWDHPRFLVRFILNCVMFRSSCLSFVHFFGVFFCPSFYG